MRIIHLTDPHLTSLADWKPGLTSGKRWLSWLSWKNKRQHQHTRAQLDALLDQLKPYQPDLFAVTGDLCQIGLESEVIEAADWLAQLKSNAEVMLVPGNHDIFASDSVGSVQQRWSAFFQTAPPGDGWPSQLDIGSVSIIGLNSSVPTAPLLASGQIGRDQLQRLKVKLEALNDRFRVVMLHHPPLAGITGRRKALKDDQALTSLLKQAGAELVLHGHMHSNLDHALTLNDGRSLRIFSTASASCTKPEHPASARIFDILPAEPTIGNVKAVDGKPSNGKAWNVQMKLLALDQEQKLQLISQQQWSSAGVLDKV